MIITILTIGSQSKPEINKLIQGFTKRMPTHIKLVWRHLKHGDGNTSSSIKLEAERILRALPKKNKIILLDKSGVTFSSSEVSKKLFSDPVNTTIIIGGAYGVSNQIIEAADIIWSLGKLTYPHQIVRLILSEQIYRAHCVNIGHPYHHA